MLTTASYYVAVITILQLKAQALELMPSWNPSSPEPNHLTLNLVFSNLQLGDNNINAGVVVTLELHGERESTLEWKNPNPNAVIPKYIFFSSPNQHIQIGLPLNKFKKFYNEFFKTLLQSP